MANVINKATIDGTDVPVVDAEAVHFTEQELEEPQKATARQNIGAIPIYNGVYTCYYWHNNAANDLIKGATSGAAVAVVTGSAISGLAAPLLVSYGSIDRGYVSFFGFDATGKMFRSTINLMHNTIDDPTIIENGTALVVNITSTTTNNETTYSADHTYAEIKAAYEARRYVYAVYGKSVCMLSNISENSIRFEVSEIVTGIPYKNLGGILRNTVAISISNDGLVTVDAHNGTYAIPQQLIVMISKSEDGIYSASMSISDICDTIDRFVDAANTDGTANISACFGSDWYRLTTVDAEKGSLIFVCEGEITKIFTGTMGVDADIWTYRELIVPNPEIKTDGQTQPVGVDADGKLWTAPSSGNDEIWKPTVSEAGDISWEKSSSTEAPAAQNIKGPTGITPNLQIGTVTTLAAGSDATASMGGTVENPTLNLGIPKGADGSGGSSAITTDTETDIAGLLMGEGGKVRKAVPDVDYLKTKELPTPVPSNDSGKYLRWFDGDGWHLESLDLYTCNVVDANGQYYCDQRPSDIQALVTAGKTIFAVLNGEPYLLTSLSAQAAVFTRVAGTTVTTITVSSDYTAALTTTELQPAGSSGGTDLSLGMTNAAVGQIAKIMAVDANGKPTAWTPVDMAGSGAKPYKILYNQTLSEAAVVKVDADADAAACNEYVLSMAIPKGDVAVAYNRYTTILCVVDCVNNIRVVDASFGTLHQARMLKSDDGGAWIDFFSSQTTTATPTLAWVPRTSWANTTRFKVTDLTTTLFDSKVELPAGTIIIIGGK